MNNTQTLVKQTIENSVRDCFLTWLLSEREMQEILISVAGDIAVGNYLTTDDDGFVTLSRPTQDATDGLPCTRDHDFRDYDYVCEECGQAVIRRR